MQVRLPLPAYPCPFLNSGEAFEASGGSTPPALPRAAAQCGVGWLDWPCCQDPGRKPVSHRRAPRAREARSQGKQSSDLRGQYLCGTGERPSPVACFRQVANMSRLAVESACFQGKDHCADLAFDRPHRCCDCPPCLSLPGTHLSEVGGRGRSKGLRLGDPLPGLRVFFSRSSCSALELGGCFKRTVVR
jgi:hypothetical protein